MSIRIAGTGSALPEYVRSNDELATLVDTNDEWIRERTGIAARRIAGEGETVASLASAACERALMDAGRNAEDVDLIIVSSCSAEQLLPCMACQVQKNIGATKAVCYDLNAACSGFLFALNSAYAYINAGLCKNALVVGSEVLSKLVDWSDRGTCILFGDGAGAVYVEGCEEDKGMQSIAWGSDGMKGDVLSCNTREGFITMDGKAVYKFATRQVPECIEEALAKAKLTAADIDHYVLHQANIRILESIAKRLSVPMEKVPHNLEHYGNMSSATIPVLLDEMHKCGTMKKGQKLVLSGFGAGLTYGACVMTWEMD
ncbi:MAG: ketoacyl-ACP synthase III [Acetatifactor sp.]|nr:ketoacyl-ACP synthase III [Acetatifactor sp.]